MLKEAMYVDKNSIDGVPPPSMDRRGGGGEGELHTSRLQQIQHLRAHSCLRSFVKWKIRNYLLRF